VQTATAIGRWKDFCDLVTRVPAAGDDEEDAKKVGGLFTGLHALITPADERCPPWPAEALLYQTYRCTRSVVQYERGEGLDGLPADVVAAATFNGRSVIEEKDCALISQSGAALHCQLPPPLNVTLTVLRAPDGTARLTAGTDPVGLQLCLCGNRETDARYRRQAIRRARPFGPDSGRMLRSHSRIEGHHALGLLRAHGP
jgi:hypothetical protein